MPDFEDIEQEAKEHGRLIDEEVAEVEKEADKAAGGQDHGVKKIGGAQGNGTSGQ